MKDKCVLCGANTEFDINTNVDYRNFYVEGAGQLCERCWNNTSDETYLTIPANYISKYTNDQELGQKIRELFIKQ